MAQTEAADRPKGAKWGWGILIGVGILLALNGVALYFISASPMTFEQDTGVSLAEVQAQYPTVAQQVVREGQIVATLLTVIGLMTGVAAFAGLREGSRWARLTVWVLLAMLVLFVIQFLIVGNRADIGGTYLVLAVIVLVGQLLARRGRRA